jgi:hypothetical protein
MQSYFNGTPPGLNDGHDIDAALRYGFEVVVAVDADVAFERIDSSR